MSKRYKGKDAHYRLQIKKDGEWQDLGLVASAEMDNKNVDDTTTTNFDEKYIHRNNDKNDGEQVDTKSTTLRFVQEGIVFADEANSKGIYFVGSNDQTRIYSTTSDPAQIYSTTNVLNQINYDTVGDASALNLTVAQNEAKAADSDASALNFLVADNNDDKINFRWSVWNGDAGGGTNPVNAYSFSKTALNASTVTAKFNEVHTNTIAPNSSNTPITLNSNVGGGWSLTINTNPNIESSIRYSHNGEKQPAWVVGKGVSGREKDFGWWYNDGETGSLKMWLTQDGTLQIGKKVFIYSSPNSSHPQEQTELHIRPNEISFASFDKLSALSYVNGGTSSTDWFKLALGNEGDEPLEFNWVNAEGNVVENRKGWLQYPGAARRDDAPQLVWSNELDNRISAELEARDKDLSFQRNSTKGISWNNESDTARIYTTGTNNDLSLMLEVTDDGNEKIVFRSAAIANNQDIKDVTVQSGNISIDGEVRNASGKTLITSSGSDVLVGNSDNRSVIKGSSVPVYKDNANTDHALALSEDINNITNKISTVQTQANEAYKLAEQAHNLASGRSAGYVFDTSVKMQQTLMAADSRTYRIGDTIFLKEEGKPDYWISNVSTVSSAPFGFYELTALESKIDLSSYQTKTDNDLTTSQKTVVGAINAIAESIRDHQTDTGNPHSVTKWQIGLGNVDNTSDLEKPISNAVKAALDNKSDTSHTHNITDLDGTAERDQYFEGLINHKADIGHTHVVKDITDMPPITGGGNYINKAWMTDEHGSPGWRSVVTTDTNTTYSLSSELQKATLVNGQTHILTTTLNGSDSNNTSVQLRFPADQFEVLALASNISGQKAFLIKNKIQDNNTWRPITGAQDTDTLAFNSEFFTTSRSGSTFTVSPNTNILITKAFASTTYLGINDTAKNATNAKNAEDAVNAQNADHALYAEEANTALTADKATLADKAKQATNADTVDGWHIDANTNVTETWIAAFETPASGDWSSGTIKAMNIETFVNNKLADIKLSPAGDANTPVYINGGGKAQATRSFTGLVEASVANNVLTLTIL